MNDIVERIDAATGRSYKDRKERHDLLYEAADEIERLRALITAWADAEDALAHMVRTDTLDDSQRAIGALRKAVGR